MPATLKCLREEHVAITALLQSLLLLAHPLRADSPPDFDALRALLFYTEEYREKRHHHKESCLLFPKLRARTPLQRGLLDRLDEEHARSEHRIRELQHALTAFECLGAPKRWAFENAAKCFVDFYEQHMGLEEREIFPLAEKVLTAEDWAELDDALAPSLQSHTAESALAPYDVLFQRIAMHVPKPVRLSSPGT